MPPSFTSMACLMDLKMFHLYLKWSAWLQRESSHWRQLVPSWSGTGDISPSCSMYSPPGAGS
jgi:hypothetical protein